MRSWLEMLSSRSPLLLPTEWFARNHPFLKYSIDEKRLDLNPLFIEHLNFADSQEHVGIQIADIAAGICGSFFRSKTKPHPAYDALYPNIIGERQNDHKAEIYVLTINEQSLNGPPRDERLGFIERR
jgi:hypothetical protein